MNCRDIKEVIENLSPKTFGKTEQKPFKEHLNKCSECRRLYKESLLLNKLLDRWETPKSKVNLQSRIMAKIAKVERERLHPIQPQNLWGQLKLLLGYRFSVPAFAAMLLAAFLCGSLIVSIVLLSRSPRFGIIANNIDKGSLKIPSIENFVQNHIEPGSKQPVVKKPAFVYTVDSDYLGYHQDAIQPGVIQPMIIVLLGVPPVRSDQPDFSSKNINNIQIQNKEDLL